MAQNAGDASRTERWWITCSAASGLGLAVLAIVWGLAADAQILLFDGVFSLLGVAMSGLALVASRAADALPSRRYPFGQEGMTPLVVGAQGAALLGSCAYAILSATLTILHGGNTPDAASGLVFAAVNMIAVLVVTVRLRRARPATDLVRAEAAGWSAAVPRTVGILAGFVAILALTGTRWRWAVPYIDPIMVLAACALAVPTAMTLLRACLDELLERAPGAHIEDPIRAEVANVATRFGLTDTTVRVSKLGPKLYVEVDAMTSTERMTVADADLAKGLLRRALTVPGRKLWLNFEIHSELS